MLLLRVRRFCFRLFGKVWFCTGVKTNMDSAKSENKNDYWVADLFQPCYTTNDLLTVDEVDRKAKYNLANDFYSKIYSQVILNEVTERNEILQAEKKSDVLAKAKENLKNKDILLAKPQSPISSTTHCWNQEEIGLFKESYEKLKERAIKLICIIESRDLKIDTLKRINKELKTELSTTQNKFSVVRMENEHLKAYASSCQKITDDLEIKLQYYEDMNNNLTSSLYSLQSQKNEIEEKFSRYKSLNKEYEQTCTQQLIKHKKELYTLEQTLRMDHESILQSLENRIQEKETLLKRKEKECDNYKDSLQSLQKHFNNLGVKDTTTYDNTTEKESFLNIVDI